MQVFDTVRNIYHPQDLEKKVATRSEPFPMIGGNEQIVEKISAHKRLNEVFAFKK